ncbi:hypothetical protein Vretimale_15508 [Volvox reticuliferus]|uniref:Fungal lipase-type domain-containing protein n=2 Tax=Volvox reticuliferus TaxID=1737510 RepID=A0A8J4GQN4_9CHLO|nr:hypothetical protein Vretimale_15508 [Volvox reticuliferus]
MYPATVSCVGNRRYPLRSCRRAPWAGCSKRNLSRLLCRVLAPPEAPGRRPRSASVDVTQSQSQTAASADFWSSTTAFASQLLSHFRASAFVGASADAVLREASTKERELQRSKELLDVSAFLSPVGVWELKRIRKLSALTVLTYYMQLVTPQRLQRAHGLTLVTTSRSCDVRSEEVSDAAEQVAADGDGMAVSLQAAKDMYQALKRDGGAAAAGPGTGTGPDGSSNIVTLSRSMPYQVISSPTPTGPSPPVTGQGLSSPLPQQQLQQQQQQQSSQQLAAGGGSGSSARPRTPRTPAEVVTAKLAEAAQAATAAATSPLASAAESIYAGLASLPIRNALVGANNRAGNALVLPPPTPAAGSGALATSTASLSSVDGTAMAPAAANAASDGASASPGNLNRKATAASITELAAEQFRQQSLLGMTGFGAGRGNAGGLTPGITGGLLSVTSPATAAAGAAATMASGASVTGAAATSVLSSSSSSFSLTFSPSSQLTCPSEWFVVDDSATHTRTFVIQGSDTLDHWKLNLTFDPVPFEDPALGVKVHRGVYEAACALYERFLPLVYEHLQSSSSPMIAFTGHSIGGSLATLLMLMYRCRGVLPPHTIATVYTFGSPAVFCQSHSHSHSAPVPYPGSTSNSWISPSLWSLSSASSVSSISSVEDPPVGGGGAPSPTFALSTGSESASKGTAGCACGADLLLARLDLPSTIVRNIIMTRDIVPRAFACDYSLVADIMKSWGSSFKEHCCLNRHGRKHLYYFVGRICILQPDSWHTFMANEADHPMLPPGPELFVLTDPDTQQAPLAAAAASEAPSSPPPPPAAVQPAARSVTEAVWELMDCPHPLETLADPGAYLATGSISRYHNPENYTKALARITHLKRLAERRLDRRLPPKPRPQARAGEAAPSAVMTTKETAPPASLPWDSSDGQDLDLHVVAPALLRADAHACR